MRNHGLSIALFGLFFLSQVALSIVGQQQYNQEQANRGQSPVSYLEYATSAAFLEATMENWESEFLQMFAYILLTVSLFQKGSASPRNSIRRRQSTGITGCRAPRMTLHGPRTEAVSSLPSTNIRSASHCFFSLPCLSSCTL
jgi:hypothetical protein